MTTLKKKFNIKMRTHGHTRILLTELSYQTQPKRSPCKKKKQFETFHPLIRTKG